MQAARREAARQRIDGRVLAGVAAVLLVLVVAALSARGPGWTTTATGPTVSTPAPATAPPTSAAPARSESPPAGHVISPRSRSSLSGWVALGVLVAVGAAVVAGLARPVRVPRWRRRRAAPVAVGTGMPDPRPLAEATARALAEVEQPDAREAVVRSWLLLGAAAATAGLPARPAETATEYAHRIGAEFYVGTAPLARLAELYREARFSDHPVRGPQRAEARNLLEQLSTELGHGRR